MITRTLAPGSLARSHAGRTQPFAPVLAGLLLLGLLLPVAGADSFRGREFLSFDRLTTDHEGVYLSPELKAGIPWNELVPSWNFRSGPTDQLTVEIQVIYPDHTTAWYNLGRWALDPSEHPRTSLKGQRDADGAVDTDTLRMQRPGGALRFRLTTTRPSAAIDFFGLSLCDTSAKFEPLPPNTNAWNRLLDVEKRTQADFPEGISEWCSPTSTSMLLKFWSDQLHRPDLNHTVPETARAVNDPGWPGTGNWPFNMAFAGAHPGLRAYVARFSDVSEIEDWIAAGLPLAFSVRYGLLQGRTDPGNGHLVVAVGFTDTGDIIVNDPGRRAVRQTYQRENLVRAWAASHQTVYLLYPESTHPPLDRFHHWTSPKPKAPGSP